MSGVRSGSDLTTNRVYERVGSDWTTRAITDWRYSWYRSDWRRTYEYGGRQLLAFAKGRANETVLCVGAASGVGPVLWPTAPPPLSLSLEILAPGGQWTFAAGFTNQPPFTPAAITWVSEDEMLLHDTTRFYSVARDGQAVEVPSSGKPEIGLAIGPHGILYSATATQVLQFVPAGTIVLSLAVPPTAAGTARLVVIAQPGKSIRVESSPDFQSWTEVQTAVSTGDDEVEVSLAHARTFFRAVLSP